MMFVLEGIRNSMHFDSLPHLVYWLGSAWVKAVECQEAHLLVTMEGGTRQYYLVYHEVSASNELGLEPVSGASVRRIIKCI